MNIEYHFINVTNLTSYGSLLVGVQLKAPVFVFKLAVSWLDTLPEITYCTSTEVVVVACSVKFTG